MSYVKKMGGRFAGKAEFIKNLEGKKLTRQEAINGFCYECLGFQSNEDCKTPDCPLYRYSPYNSTTTP